MKNAIKMVHAIAALAIVAAPPAAAQGPARVPGEHPGMHVPAGGQVTTMSIEQLPPIAKERALQELAAAKALRTTDDGALPGAAIEEDRFRELDKMRSHAKAASHYRGKLSVELATLEGPFAAMTFQGMVHEGTSIEPPWSWVTRMYSTPDGKTVILSEWNMKADNGGILQIREFLNQEVGGNPATLTVARSDSGTAVWTLSWVRESIRYKLQVVDPEPSGNQGKGYILDLARSLRFP